MKIALIQQKATSDYEQNLRKGIESFHEAAKSGADLIAFAELAFLPFLPQIPASSESLSYAETIPGPVTKKFCDLAKEYEVVVILNIFEKEGAKTYDSSPVIDTNGEILGTVRMVHVMEGPGFHEKGYYSPGDRSDFVFETSKGKIGVAICYDRHFPEYMRNLSLQGAEIVVVPQAGAVNEWAPGIFESELQIAAFQNGYFAALVNRVGKEEVVHFAGRSFVVDPFGQIMAQASGKKDCILYADCDFDKIKSSPAKRFFLNDRRPEFYFCFDLLKKNEV